MSQRIYHDESILLLKQESTEGVDASPSTSTDAMKVFNLDVNPLETTEEALNYMRGYPGAADSIITAAWATVSFEVPYIGAATPGTAPAIAAAMRCAGHAETLIAVAVTGTAQAGSAIQITLAADASAVDGYYDGLIVTITGGTGSGQSFIGWGYVGSTKVLKADRTLTTALDGISQYSIAPSAIYTPIRGSATPSCTLHFNDGGVLHKFLGGRGSVALDSMSGAVQRLKFNFVGALGTPVDQSPPTANFSAWQDPLPFLTEYARMTLAGLPVDGSASGLQSKGLTFDKRAQVDYRVLIGSTGAVLSGHDGGGQVTIEQPLLAVHDFFTDCKLGNSYPFFLRNGTTAGKRTVFFMPKMKFKKPNPSVDQGIKMLGIDYSAQPVNGLDDYRFIFS